MDNRLRGKTKVCKDTKERFKLKLILNVFYIQTIAERSIIRHVLTCFHP